MSSTTAYIGQYCDYDEECDQSSAGSYCSGYEIQTEVEYCDTSSNQCELAIDITETCYPGCCLDTGGYAYCQSPQCSPFKPCIDPDPTDCIVKACVNPGSCGAGGAVCVDQPAPTICGSPSELLTKQLNTPCGQPIPSENGCGTCGFGTNAALAGCDACLPGGVCQLCGDEIVNGNEQCDLGAGQNLDCSAGGSSTCSSTCRTQDCTPPPTHVCGDGIVTGSEECDGTNFNGKDCWDYGGHSIGGLICNPPGSLNECKINSNNCARCGDGVVNLPGEECDPPNYPAGSTCANYGLGLATEPVTCRHVGVPPNTFGCKLDYSACGASTYVPPGSGCYGGAPDGIAQTNLGEECDPGPPSDMPKTVCTQLAGFSGGTLGCTNNCEFDTSACIVNTGPCTDSITPVSCTDQTDCDAAFPGVTGSGDRYACVNGKEFLSTQTIECRADNFCWWKTDSCESCYAQGKECGVIAGALRGCKNPPPSPPPDLAAINNLAVAVRRQGVGSYASSLTTTHPAAVDVRLSWTISDCFNNCDIQATIDCTNDGTPDRTVTQTSQSSETDSMTYTCPQAQYSTPSNYVVSGRIAVTKPDGTNVSITSTTISLTNTCGNGNIDPGEQCDGNNHNSQTCMLQGYDGGVLSCNSNCTFSYSNCYTCGDNIAAPAQGEECDGTDLQGKKCTDYGFNMPGGLACSPTCTIDISNCATCGDGLIQGIETCDDNNNVSGDGCSQYCQQEPMCAGVTPLSNTQTRTIGDTIYNVNTTGVQGATAVQIRSYSAYGGTDDQRIITATDIGGNKWTADVDTTQHVESGTVIVQSWLMGTPTLFCAASNYYNDLCGNGIQDIGEQCDTFDFNTTCIDHGFMGGTLLCNPDCSANFSNCNNCGNGIVEPGEQCDLPPNGDDSDGCTDSCRFPTINVSIIDAVPDPTQRINITTVRVNVSTPFIDCVGVRTDSEVCVFHEWEAGTDYAIFNCTAGISCTLTDNFYPFIHEAPIKNCTAGFVGGVATIGISPALENTMLRCSNTYDDDCDGNTDAADTDCWPSFTGHIYDDNNAPLSAAVVSVLVPNANKLDSTSGTGYFGISQIPPGNYSVTVIKPGYQARNDWVEFPVMTAVTKDYTMTNGSCLGCLDWEGRCSTACSGSPQCGATVPSACENVLPNEWRRYNSTHAAQCCAAQAYKPLLNSSFDVDGCMEDLVTHERLVRYQGELITLRVYSWNTC